MIKDMQILISNLTNKKIFKKINKILILFIAASLIASIHFFVFSSFDSMEDYMQCLRNKDPMNIKYNHNRGPIKSHCGDYLMRPGNRIGMNILFILITFVVSTIYYWLFLRKRFFTLCALTISPALVPLLFWM